MLEEQQRPPSEYGEYGDTEDSEESAAEEAGAEAEPVAHTPLDLAADARYAATGKRKRAVARVILRPGEGAYTVNKRPLDEYFPRIRLQRMAHQPLDAAGYEGRWTWWPGSTAAAPRHRPPRFGTASPAPWWRPTPRCAASSSAVATSRATRA